MLNSSLPTPPPMAVMSACTSLFFNILSRRARSTFRIFPRIGRMACVRGSRASTAVPPAESPSTMNSSLSAGSPLPQSFNLSGMPAPESAVLRRMALRAFFAAIRACAAATAFFTTRLASVGFSWNHSSNLVLVSFWTNERIETLPSFALVCPSNWGSRNFTDTTAVTPSRMSSPSRFSSFSFNPPEARAYLFTTEVSAVLKPSTCMPPSTVEMPLA